MALLNFHKTFAPAVASLQKRQTIRAQRKRPIEIGEWLHLYTGCRTKQARRLLPPQICIFAVPIRIVLDADTPSVVINGRKLSAKKIRDLAKADGFPNIESFFAWFLPPGTQSFTGQLIQW